MTHERTMALVLTDRQVMVLGSALDGYNAEPCHGHLDGDHGDETECDGWGPEDLRALREVGGIVANAEARVAYTVAD